VGVDPRFDVTGWNSSYTGGPIATAAMAEWVDATETRIAAFAPDRVLEIGCGTGLVLWRLAPGRQTYVGTDFSAATLDVLASRLAGGGLGRVQLWHRHAGPRGGARRLAGPWSALAAQVARMVLRSRPRWLAIAVILHPARVTRVLPRLPPV